MRSIAIAPIALLSCACLLQQDRPRSPPRPAPAPTASDAETPDAPTAVSGRADADGNGFTLKMYGRFSANPGNLFFSGPSLRSALGIAYLGARGDTAAEMATALDFDADTAKVAADAKAEIAAWKAAGRRAQLAIANRLWPDRSLALNPSFETTVADAYGAAPEGVDFMHDAEYARGVINRWVAQQTVDKIRELLPTGSLTDLTRLVITNAIYFKGKWRRTFAESSTRTLPFKVDAKSSKDTPMMHQTGAFRIARAAGVKMLELPYADTYLAMDIVLPDDDPGLGRVEESLSIETLGRWLDGLSNHRVAVTVPKFKLAWGGSVSVQLKEVGMVKAFDPKTADFTGLVESSSVRPQLYVSDVFHKTFVAVDEMGTEAAAATGVVIHTKSARPPPIEFRADHPFLFFIRDTRSGRMLFAGRVVDPTASG